MPTHPSHISPRSGEIDRRSFMPLLGAGAAFARLAGKALAQQVAIPTTAAEVPGPPPGTTMTKAYVQSMGRTAYLWGWPLVNMANRGAAFSKAPEPRFAWWYRAGRIRTERDADRVCQPGRDLRYMPEPRRRIRAARWGLDAG